MPRNPDCTDCGLHKSSKNRCIWGHGTGPGFIIGEAPGPEEARTGLPFQGKSGQLLRGELRKLEIDDSYITNTAKCRPPDKVKPSPGDVKACSKYLKEELETRKPKAVLLLGNIASKAVIRKAGITGINGQVIEKDGVTYVPCVHPSYVLRDLAHMGMFQSALRRYASVLKGTFSNEVNIPVTTIRTPTHVESFRDGWKKAKDISFDVETTGLDWFSEEFKINVISFSMSPGQTWVLPMAKDSSLPPARYMELLLWCMDNQNGKRMISQNGKFDNHCLHMAGLPGFRNDFDTLLAAHLIDENTEHDLKSLARVRLNAPDYDDLTVKEKQGDVDPARLFKYGSSDAYYTRELVQGLHQEIAKDPSLPWIFDRLIMPCARALETIEENGLFVDLPLLNQMSRQEKRNYLRTESELNKMIGGRINWNSPQQVGKVLYEDLDLKCTVLTDKGANSTGEEALADLDHPVVDKLIEHRGHAKFLSTYLGDPDTNTGGWRDFMVGPHLYLSMKIHGTVTGRWSSRLHQVPRDGVVRNCITAPRGWHMVVGDFNQAELRLAAMASRDPALIACYKNGVDVHWRTLMNSLALTGEGEYIDLVYSTAAKVARVSNRPFLECLDLITRAGPSVCESIDKNWKEARKKAKSENFGYLYGMYPKKYVIYAKTKYGFTPTMAQATAAREAFFALYQGLPGWHDRQKKLVHLDGQVRNIIGRIRHLPSIHSSDREAVGEAEREAINAPIQGGVGDLKAMALVEIHETVPRDQVRVVGEVHDSILMWVRDQHLERVMPRIHYIMENPTRLKELGIKLTVPIVADLEVGPWGKGRKWKLAA